MQGPALLKFLIAVLSCAAMLAARADEIEVRDVRLAASDDGLTLEADFAFDLNPRLGEMVANGVPVYFVVEFELTRLRWWWFDEKTAAKRMQLRLSYHPLTRQYRLSTGMLQQQFHSLDEALHVLKRVRNWLVVDRGVTLAEANHEAAVRMRLDISLLPKPFQISAITSRELHLESSWRRFAFRSPPAAAEPLDTREPREAGTR
ncbi:MAG: hypothetical protein A2Z64_03100 [Betaproteobacteria bacterium RIFCSPLOWO2_02_67_12]|nr:MAG: hypothetical protein A2Z64_03100 [Betaproteobacteria bacterium RIFCSPLOWO2_02_67_12]OGA30711.1 MAG: hypothetical protein A3I65_03990 [Betaproteobacteria bacterium RIFCSPLOWO2_02_FULL_68_150]OGA65985.1 MAG: hypothetical protein A3F77_00975 [Betaproteobacteria bacterium RIFCSPLOWO2_12_FULL_67_28]